MAVKTTWDINGFSPIMGGEIIDRRFYRALSAAKEADESEPPVKQPTQDQSEEPAQDALEDTPVTEIVEINDSVQNAGNQEINVDGDSADIDSTTDSEVTQPAPENNALVETKSDNRTDEISEAKDPKPTKQSNKSNKLKPKKAKTRHIRHRKLIIVSAVLVFLIATVIGGGWQYYRHKVLPNTYVAGQIVSGMSRQQLADLLNTKQQAFSVTLTNDKQTLKPKQADLGLSFNTDETITQAFAANRTGSVWQHIAWWQRNDVELNPSVDNKKFDKYLATSAKTANKKPHNAKLIFDTNTQTFEIQKDIDGSGILVSKAVDSVLESAKQAQSVTVSIPTQALTADIVASNLSDSLAQARSYLRPAISIKLEDTVVSPTQAQKASWISISANKQNSYDIGVDKSKITDYVTAISVPYHQDTQDRITIKDKSGAVSSVLQNGIDGKDVVNQSAIATALADTFVAKNNYTGTLKVSTTKYKSQDITSLPRWAIVSLTSQTLTAYEYGKPVKSFLISSGVAQYPTPTGVFKVWYKTPNQTMKGGSLASGDYYDLPNVHWDTYFNGDVAVHEAYWHNNFGHPMSHGCINATYADAEWFYNFAPIGTTVVVVS